MKPAKAKTKSGKEILFKTHEELVYDKYGISLKDRLFNIKSKLDSVDTAVDMLNTQYNILESNINVGRNQIIKSLNNKGLYINNSSSYEQIGHVIDEIVLFEEGTSDATADKEHIVDDYVGYSKGNKIVGIIPVTTADGVIDEVGYINRKMATCESINPKGFQAVELPEDTNCSSIMYDGSKFISCSEDKFIYSSDGINWEVGTFPELGASSYPTQIVYGDGKYIALMTYGDVYYYSNNGIDWQKYSFNEERSVTSLVYGDGKFVGFNMNMQTGAIMTTMSTDGITWVDVDITSIISLPITTVIYTDNKFMAIPLRSVTTDEYIYSNDGINWEVGKFPISANWGAIGYGDGKYVVTTYANGTSWSDDFVISTDGINWEVGKLPSKGFWDSISYGNGYFIVLDDGTTSEHAYDNAKALYSVNGYDWVETSLPLIENSRWTNVVYGDGKFVAVTNRSSDLMVDSIAAHLSFSDVICIPVPSNTYLEDIEFIKTNIIVTKPDTEIDGINYIDINESDVKLVNGNGNDAALIPVHNKTYIADGVRIKVPQSALSSILKYPLESIRVRTMPTKVSYIYGERLNLSGMVVEAVNSKGEVKVITDYTVNKSGALTSLGENTITISYTEYGVTKTTTINVTVKNQLASIAVTTNPTKMVYIYGETFNVGDMVVTATYIDSSTKVITGYNYTAGRLTTIGTDTVTISYTEDGVTKTTTINVTVKNQLASIAVTTNPTKMVYINGETFNSTGMVVTATYVDGSTKSVTNYTTNAPSKFTTNGVGIIVISYTDDGVTKTTTLNVIVANPVTGIAVTTPPSKTEYIYGETLDLSGMVVTATYTNNETKVITDYTVDKSSTLTTLGSNTITISYADSENGGTVFNTTLNVIVVNSITGIAVTTPPSKTEYIYGETLDLSGMVVTATYANNETKVITDYTTNAPSVVTSLGVNTITISYTEDGITKTTNITISSDLQDFTWSDNGDGTYNIVDWKGTKNGVSSTELVVPAGSNLIL